MSFKPILTLVVGTVLASGVGADDRRPSPQANADPHNPIGVPPVPGALPPGLYRAGAVPLPPPAFYDPNIYYFSGYGPYGGGSYLGCGGGLNQASSAELARRARIPYRTAIRDAQAYHYLNQYITRDERLRAQNYSMTDEGTAQFRRGDYERAAVTLLGAAGADEGDALSRVRAGHALFALGRYPDAVELIRRGFELQPRLATLGFDLRDEYDDQSAFSAHVQALEAQAASTPTAANLTLLGYVRYYTSGPGSAYETLQRARRLNPGNGLVDKLLAVSAKVYSPNAPRPSPTVNFPPQPPARTAAPAGVSGAATRI